MSVQIRPYREEDRERLKEITIAAFPGVSIDRLIEEQFGLLNGVDWAVRKRQSIDADCDAHPAGILVLITLIFVLNLGIRYFARAKPSGAR